MKLKFTFDDRNNLKIRVAMISFIETILFILYMTLPHSVLVIAPDRIVILAVMLALPFPSLVEAIVLVSRARTRYRIEEE